MLRAVRHPVLGYRRSQHRHPERAGRGRAWLDASLPACHLYTCIELPGWHNKIGVREYRVQPERSVLREAISDDATRKGGSRREVRRILPPLPIVGARLARPANVTS